MTDNEQRCPEHRIRDCAPLLNGCSWRPGAAAVTPPAQDGLAFRSGADREGDGWLHDTVPAAPSVSTDHTDIGELRELAEAATPGPWKWSVSVDRQWALVETAEDNLRILAQLPDDDDAAFIAAASPDVILALVAELVGLRTEVDQLRGERRRCNAIGHPTVTPESLIPCQLDRLLAMHPSDRTLYALKCAFEDEQRASQKEEQR